MRLRIANIGEDDFKLVFSSIDHDQQEPIPERVKPSEKEKYGGNIILDLEVSRDEMIKVLVTLIGKSKMKSEDMRLGGLLTQERCVEGLERKESDELLLFIFFQLLWVQHNTNNFPAVGVYKNLAIYESDKNKLLTPLTYMEQDKVKAALYIVLEDLFVEKDIIFSKYVNFNKKRSIEPELSYLNAILSTSIPKRTSVTDSFADKDAEAYKIRLSDVRSLVDYIFSTYLFRLQFATVENLVSIGNKDIICDVSVNSEPKGDGSILSWLEFE